MSKQMLMSASDMVQQATIGDKVMVRHIKKYYADANKPVEITYKKKVGDEWVDMTRWEITLYLMQTGQVR